MTIDTNPVETVAKKNKWKVREGSKLLRIATTATQSAYDTVNALDSMMFLGDNYVNFMKEKGRELAQCDLETREELLSELHMLL